MAKISIKQKVDEKLIPLRQANRGLSIRIQSLTKDKQTLKKEREVFETENITLKADIVVLKDWIERLLEYTKMSEKDLKELVKSAEKTNEAKEIVSRLFDFCKLFGNY